MAEARSGALTDPEAAHGLEQQLIYALIQCLSSGPAAQETPAGRRHRCILARFEDLLRADASHSMTEICALRSGTPGTASVSEVARRYGFRDPGRFATNYRALYGELPSATLRRSLRGITELSLHRPV
jgi:AraC-like DNA-binding protein